MRGKALVGVFAIAAVVVVVARRDSRENKAALASAVVSDAAELDGPEISWEVSADGISASLLQSERAVFIGGKDLAWVATDEWHVEIRLYKIFDVRCYVTGGEHGYPRYGFVSFLPEGADHASDAMFSIGFASSVIDTLEQLCAKHGIRIER
jgi:hypothetical protein